MSDSQMQFMVKKKSRVELDDYKTATEVREAEAIGNKLVANISDTPPRPTRLYLP